MAARFDGAMGKISAKSGRLREARGKGSGLRCRYDMELSVLVGILERAEQVQEMPSVLPAVVPSYIWLKMADRSLVPLCECPDRPVPVTL